MVSVRQMHTLFVSVIIPVLNDAGARGLLGALEPTEKIEIIVVDAGGGVAMSELMNQFPSCRWTRSSPGRAVQMNAGAQLARGTWLLFLHADTWLPANWLDEVRRADSECGAVWGCLAFALDSTDWRARVIERGVAVRVRYFGLPYGDQALFVRREVFERLGGYTDVPLMEDVDLVRRLHCEGLHWFSAAPAITSARRWHHEGWLRRSAKNVSLMLQYLAGVSPVKLAKKYYRGTLPPTIGQAAVAVMARARPTQMGRRGWSASFQPRAARSFGALCCWTRWPVSPMPAAMSTLRSCTHRRTRVESLKDWVTT